MSIPEDCTEEIVKVIAGKLGGGAGPSSMDAIPVKGWLLRHGRASQVLWEELVVWTEWLYNESSCDDGSEALRSGQVSRRQPAWN